MLRVMFFADYPFWLTKCRSGTSSILLSMALNRLPNLRPVLIDCNDQSYEDMTNIRQGLSQATMDVTSRAFCALSGCLPFSKTKLLKLRFLSPRYLTDYPGVSLQALDLPRGVMNCFSELQQLDLIVWPQYDVFYQSKKHLCAQYRLCPDR